MPVATPEASGEKLPEAVTVPPVLQLIVRERFMEVKRFFLLKRIFLFYGIFLAVSLLMVATALWEIISALREHKAVLPLPAAIFLLVGACGLVFEFCLGFKVDLKELRRS